MSEQKKLELDVRGMTCPSCAHHVENALNKVEGVEKAHIPGWQSNKVTLSLTDDVDEQELINAVELAGYKASLKDHKTPISTDLPQGFGNGNHQNDFDLMVIGAGSAGFAAAIKGTDLGFRVAMVGDGTLGGTCVNVGCVPSKALIRAAEAWHNAGHYPFKGVPNKTVWIGRRFAVKRMTWLPIYARVNTRTCWLPTQRSRTLRVTPPSPKMDRCKLEIQPTALTATWLPQVGSLT
jgi:copper chaperone CopZ